MLGDLVRRFTGIGGARSFSSISERPESQPIATEGRLPTVLAIHGFTGTPGEVQSALEVAQQLGLATVAPLLAGHGRDAGALAETSYSDWLASAKSAFDEARSRGPVVVVGLSLGSLIATELCLSAPGDVCGLVLLSNAFWLKPPHPAYSLRLASRFGVSGLFMDKHGADIADPGQRRSHATYDAQPILAATEVEATGRRLRGELYRQNRPTLLVHGALDAVCPVSNAWKVANALGTRDSRIVILPRSKHIVTRDRDVARLKAELALFYKRVGHDACPW